MVSMNRPPSPGSRPRIQPRVIPPPPPRIYRQPTDIHFDLPPTPTTTIPQVVDLQFDATNPVPPSLYDSYPSSPQERDMSPDFLVRAAQASRLRRRGAIRIENSAPSSAHQRDHTPERGWSILEEQSRSNGSTVTPLIITKDELGTGDQIYSLYCGGRVPPSPSTPAFKPSPLPYASSSSTSQCLPSPPSTGCGSLIHHRVAPSQRLGLWTGNALATPIVATLDPNFCDQDLVISDGSIRYPLSAGNAKCGCTLECIGCTVCGNSLGYQVQPCYRHYPSTVPANRAHLLPSSTTKRPPLYAFDPRATSHNPRWPTPFPFSPREPSATSNDSSMPRNSALEPNAPVALQPRSDTWELVGDVRNTYFPRAHSPPPMLMSRRVRYPSGQIGDEDEDDDSTTGGYLEELAHATPFVSILERRVQYNHMDPDDDDDDMEAETGLRPSIMMSDALRPISSITFQRSSSFQSASPGSRQHHRSTSSSNVPILVRSLTSSSFADHPAPSPSQILSNASMVTGPPIPLASPTSPTSASPYPAPSPAPTSQANVRSPSAPSIMMLSRRQSSHSSLGYRPAMRSPLATAPLTPSLVLRRSTSHLATSSTTATRGGDDDDDEMPGLVPVTRYTTPRSGPPTISSNQDSQVVTTQPVPSESATGTEDANANPVASSSSTATASASQNNRLTPVPNTTFCETAA